MQPTPNKFRLTLLGLLFVSVVVAVFSYTHQLIVPIFLGLFTWGKAWLKTLTPKLGLLLLKNGFFIQIRKFVTQASAHVFLKSHRPLRHWLAAARTALATTTKQWFDRYMGLALWARTIIALTLLLLTAGSSFAVFALLIVPQPVLNWMRKQVMTMLNKLGVTKFSAALWRFAVPQALRHRWHMYVKWSLGRRQVVAAKSLNSKIKRPNS